MAAARNYRRQLFMLYSEDKGFGKAPGKEPTGFLKLEVKGSAGQLTYVVQNLRDIKDEGLFYKGFIGVSSDASFVVTGTIPVSGGGRGESAWRFDPENVGGTGHGIDSFDVFGVIVLKPGDREHRIVCPLAGHTGKISNDWKGFLRRSMEGTANVSGAAPGRNEMREAVETCQKDAGTVEAVKAMSPTGKSEAAKAEKPPEPGMQKTKPEYGVHSGFERFIEEALKLYPGVQPFEQPDQGSRWWRINSFGYLFGVRYDEDGSIRYYAYGIPGVYQTQAQMQMEAYGFYKWRPLKGEGHIPGERGYWLAYVDAKTGVLANPAT